MLLDVNHCTRAVDKVPVPNKEGVVRAEFGQYGCTLKTELDKVYQWKYSSVSMTELLVPDSFFLNKLGVSYECSVAKGITLNNVGRADVQLVEMTIGMQFRLMNSDVQVCKPMPNI